MGYHQQIDILEGIESILLLLHGSSAMELILLSAIIKLKTLCKL